MYLVSCEPFKAKGEKLHRRIEEISAAFKELKTPTLVVAVTYPPLMDILTHGEAIVPTENRALLVQLFLSQKFSEQVNIVNLNGRVRAAKQVYTGYFFDCEGKQIIEAFDTESAVYKYADNHNLEVWKVK